MAMIVQGVRVVGSELVGQGNTRRLNERCQVGVASLRLHLDERDKVR
jgi:hypothetical protein